HTPQSSHDARQPVRRRELSPGRQPQYGRGVVEHDPQDGRLQTDVEIVPDRRALLIPWIGLGERRLGDLLQHLLLDLLDDRLEEVALVAKVVIEGAARDARAANDLLGRDVVVAVPREELARDPEELRARDPRLLRPA